MLSIVPRHLLMFPPQEGDDPARIWLDFADDPNPSNRDRLIYLTMREVAIVGPASFNTAGVCDALGISYPMVNYYFGNRDGLIAEAGHVTYVRYVQKLWDAVEQAPRTPVDRLRAWFEAHLRLNIEIRGWGAVLNYPRFSSSIEEILDERFGDDHRRHFSLNVARLTRLVLDLWSGSVEDFPYGLDDFPREQLLAESEAVKVVATLSWATLGVAVWRAGRHTPSKGITDLDRMGEELIEAHTENMIRFAIESRPH
jgi:AcrR family transcriptional regulator